MVELGRQFMPFTMYHATTSVSSFQKHGPLTRMQLEDLDLPHARTGLSGGPEDSLSLTPSQEYAHYIHNQLHFMHKTLHAEPGHTFEDLVQQAHETPIRGNRFGPRLMYLLKDRGGPGAVTPEHYEEGPGSSHIWNRQHLATSYMRARDEQYGPKDVQFFGGSAPAFHALDRGDFGVITLQGIGEHGVNARKEGDLEEASELAEWRHQLPHQLSITGVDQDVRPEMFYNPGGHSIWRFRGHGPVMNPGEYYHPKYR